MNIITGYRGEAHITADQIRDQNQGCFGDGSYILDVGSKLEATAVSATSVQLADGIISHQGCTASIPYGSTDAVTIGNGTQGMQRIDLIVARYTKDAGTGVEDMSLAVIQGTPAASNPSTPSYNQGSIHAGDSPVDMPLFEVAIDGISIDSITQVASVVKTQAETDAEISALNSSLNNKFDGTSFTTGSATSAGISFTIPNSYRGVVFLADANADRCGEYIVFSTSAGAVTYKTITATSGVTIATATNRISFTTTGTANTRICFLNMLGYATET